MLILTRKEQESIDVFIGNEKILRFTITKITDDKKIRIGFDAPSSVTIVRTELTPEEVETHQKQIDEESNTS